MVGHDHAAGRVVPQWADFGLDLDAHQPGGRQAVEPGENAAVVRVEGAAQANEQAHGANGKKMQPQQEHTQ
ncbi:hypothetical protein D3C72_2327240 [compost metagenome]